MPDVSAFAMVGPIDGWPGGFAPLHLLRLEEGDRVEIHLAVEPGSSIVNQDDELRRLEVDHRIFSPAS